MGCGEAEALGVTHSVDLDVVVQVLGLDGEEERPEPLERAEVAADPEEVNFAQASPALRIVQTIPYALQDGSKRCDANSRSDKHRNLELEDVFRSASERAVDEDSWENLPQARIDTFLVLSRRDALDDAAASFLLAGRLPFEIAAERHGERFCEVPDASDMHRDVVLLRSAGESEWVVLPDGHLRAAKKDVLRSESAGSRT